MNREQFSQFKRQMCDEVIRLTDKKNEDYADAVDVFRNIKASSTIGVDPKVGVLIRLQDKLARAGNLIGGKQAAVQDESVQDTVKDIVGYSLILLGLMEEDRLARKSSPTSDFVAEQAQDILRQHLPSQNPHSYLAGPAQQIKAYQDNFGQKPHQQYPIAYDDESGQGWCGRSPDDEE